MLCPPPPAHAGAPLGSPARASLRSPSCPLEDTVTLDALSAAPNARLDTLITRVAPILTWVLAAGMAFVGVGLASSASIEPGQDYECFVDEGRVEFSFIAAKFVFPAVTLAAVIVVASKSRPGGGLPENRGGGNGLNDADADAAADDDDDDDDLLALETPDRTSSSPTAGEQLPLLQGTADGSGFDVFAPPVNWLQPHEFNHRVYIFTEIFCLLLTMTHVFFGLGLDFDRTCQRFMTDGRR